MQSFDENINLRKGKRVGVGVGINSFLHELDESDEASKKAFRTAKVQNMFKECIRHIYQDSTFLILQSINAVYILNERDKGMLKKAQPGSKNIKRLIIYTNDSLVYADLDARQEQVKLWFMNHGEHIDKLELMSSKFQMRRRFPYKSDVEMLKKNLTNEKVSKAKLVLPSDTSQIDVEIEKIQDEKLQQAINNLVHPNK